MALPTLFLDETLPIRRLGPVTHATAVSWVRNQPTVSGGPVENSDKPITFPTHLPMGGWRLQYPSPTTGELVTDNELVRLFQKSRYSDSIRLHTFSLPNIGLLDSIASVFDHLRVDDQREKGIYGYASMVPPTRPLWGGGTPNLHYYRPVENPTEQYLLLYDNRINMYERPGDDETPSYTNLYELVQVELDEDRFVHLLRQAIEAAPRIRNQRIDLYAFPNARRNGASSNSVT